MQKIILSLCFVLTLAAGASAQKIHVGGKFGANLGKIDGQSFKQEYKLGYQAGVFVDLAFNKNWGIQPELLFSQTTTTVDSGFKAIYQDFPNAVIGSKAKLNYLSIPVLLNLNAGKMLTLQLGPQFSIKTNKNETLVQNGKEAFKSGDLAAVFGAQVNVGALKVYGRYNIGLDNLNDLGSQDKWKSQQIQLGLGLKIL